MPASYRDRRSEIRLERLLTFFQIPDRRKKSNPGSFVRSPLDYPVLSFQGSDFNESLLRLHRTHPRDVVSREASTGRAPGSLEIMRAKRIEEETRFRLLRYTHRAKCRKII
ncbi:unnamed protein product [Xylocopa violacea]|uniref:Ribosomal protein S4 n=1 Tax=Xylocopa violacea TaxID=135666 RepID=A0ABP1NCE6_XYLVO